MKSQFRLLADLLSDADGFLEIGFFEDDEHGRKHSVTISCDDDHELLAEIASFFGCPDDDLPDGGVIRGEASWAKNGEGNLNELAEDIELREGALFDVTYTVNEIRAMAKE